MKYKSSNSPNHQPDDKVRKVNIEFLLSHANYKNANSFLTESLKVIKRHCWTYGQYYRRELLQAVNDGSLVNIECIFIEKVGVEITNYNAEDFHRIRSDRDTTTNKFLRTIRR